MQGGKILKPGLLITIEVKPGEDWAFAIGSVSDDFNQITCETLMDYPQSVIFKSNEDIVITCLTGEGIYRFPVRIVDVQEDPLQLTLALLKGVNQIQRREFFRLSKPQVRVKYRAIDGPEDIFDKDLKEAPVRDLSGNGIALVIPIEDELEAGAPVKVEIEVSDSRNVNVIGEVVRCVPNQPINGRSILCLYFSLIEEKERGHIVGHLFKEQLYRAGRKRQLYGRS